ncbi:MAG: TIGR00296 family protein [Hadesarchaea archaeon]|nr:TIGR00296 family protein [Hadesarchaea archaeon]
MIKLEDGEFLIELARKSIKKYLEEGEKPEPSTDISEELTKKHGIFVTLRKNEELRGCIGRPLPTQSLVDGIIDSAISSAVGDPRFPNLQENELKNTIIEISVLTKPEIIEVESPKEYPEKIEVGKDGLIVELHGSKGLLLPQVPVEQGWGAEEFLSNTCLKAHLNPDCWLKKDVKIKKFSGQIFVEKEPGGEIKERSISGD